MYTLRVCEAKVDTELNENQQPMAREGILGSMLFYCRISDYVNNSRIALSVSGVHIP